MTTLELELNLPDRLAREAQAAGLLTPKALARMLKDAIRRRAGQAFAVLSRVGRLTGGVMQLMEITPAMRRFVSSLLLASLVAGGAQAQAQELKREVFAPAAEKGAIVIVVSGVSGTALYRDYGTRLAGLGYYTVLIDGNDVLIRARDSKDRDGAANLRKIIADAQAAPQAAAGKVALVGFSLGGGGVLLHGAPLKDSVSAVIAYYPAITKLGPDMAPLASGMQVPVLVFAGGQDRYFNCCLAESARALEAAAKARQAAFELVVYADAGHGFNLSVPAYRAGDANDAWTRTTALLHRLHPARAP